MMPSVGLRRCSYVKPRREVTSALVCLFVMFPDASESLHLSVSANTKEKTRQERTSKFFIKFDTGKLYEKL